MIELEAGESVLVMCQALANPAINPSKMGAGNLLVTDRRLIWERHWLSFPWWGSRVIEVRYRDIEDTEVRAFWFVWTLRITTRSGVVTLWPYDPLPFVGALSSGRLTQLLHRELDGARKKVQNDGAAS